MVETGSSNLLKQDRFNRNPYTNLVKILKETVKRVWEITGKRFEKVGFCRSGRIRAYLLDSAILFPLCHAVSCFLFVSFIYAIPG